MLRKGVLLRVMRNTRVSDNTLLNRGVETLGARLPNGWRLSLGTPAGSDKPKDAILTIRGPDGATANLLVEAKRSVSPRQAAETAANLVEGARKPRAAALLLISDYLSNLSRSKLHAAGINYLDLTGNVRISIDRPALVMQTQGSDRNPAPDRRGVRSLKGAKAARIVRALCDIRPPMGVRQLARLSGTNAGYASRILKLLLSDDVVQKDPSGRIVQSDWQNLIRRWSQDYSLAKTNRAIPCLAPRGIADMVERLATLPVKYALTGSLAIPAEASVATGRLAMCYLDDPEQVATVLGLRSTETGSNVLLVEPFDPVVYVRARTEDGLVKVALTQCAVDLLSSGGRGPAEADALLEWMARNENAWRT